MTARLLTYGTAASAAALAIAFVAGLAGIAWLSTLLSTAGVVTLLVTPAVGLAMTFIEMRPVQPRAALLALMVLGVLVLSAVVALLAH
jgi:hypothetical protein